MATTQPKETRRKQIVLAFVGICVLLLLAFVTIGMNNFHKQEEKARVIALDMEAAGSGYYVVLESGTIGRVDRVDREKGLIVLEMPIQELSRETDSIHSHWSDNFWKLGNRFSEQAEKKPKTER